MRKFYLLSIIIFSLFQSYAQENNFYVKQRFLEGEKVKLFSQNRGAAVVILEDNTIHLMNKEFQFTDISDQLESNIREDVTSIACINESIFFLGTKGNSLFMYDNGEVTNIKDLKADFPEQINSIDYSSGAYQEKLLIATNDSLWVSNDFRTYERSGFEFSANPKFYSGRNSILLESEDYYGCYDVESEYSIFARVNVGSLIYKIFQNEDFDIDKLYDIEYGRYTGNNGFYGLFAFYATHNGVYAQSIGECSFDTAVHITDVAVYDLEMITNQGLSSTAMLAASDTGLFYSEVSQYDFDIYGDQTYYEVEGIDSAFIIDYSIFHNTIWVGTNNGLVQVQEDDLTQDSLEPEPIAFDTIYYCQDQGAYLNAGIHSQIDKQWFKNGEEIEGAISSIFIANEEALYSIEYEFEDSLYHYDVAYTKLEDEFNETIVNQDYLICPDDYSVWLRINNKNYPNHDYSWYSVERGLEFETANTTTSYFYAQEAGNYYFIANNCNGFTYHSDTVVVRKSSLGDEFFSVSSNENLCTGDTVFIENSDAGVDFEWDITYADLEGYNEAFLVLKEEYSGNNLHVRMTDEFGCTDNLYASIGNIYPLPTFSEGQKEIYICEEEDYVYFDLDEGLSAEWAGSVDGVDYKVAPGIYPVTISNGFCPDYNVEVEIKYFDPFPMLNFEDTVIEVGDTFKIPTNGKVGINWDGEIQVSNDQSYLYLTSDIADTLQSELWFSSADCDQVYDFTIIFDGQPILNNDSQDMGFRLYPNPAKKGLNIDQAKSTIECIQLMNSDGRIVDTKYFQNASNLYFDFPSHLEAGIYFIRITDINNQVVTRKIILE